MNIRSRVVQFSSTTKNCVFIIRFTCPDVHMQYNQATSTLLTEGTHSKAVAKYFLHIRGKKWAN
jgi:hypothetical protein